MLYVRIFVLNRLIDESGVSGKGIVAIGIEFPDGTIVLKWREPYHSFGIYKNIEEIVAVHGHDGKTKIVMVEEVRISGESGVSSRTSRTIEEICNSFVARVEFSPDEIV